jgi:hypothetical protein
MTGIYLTQKGKQEIEAKIAELKDYTYATQDIHLEGSIQGHIYALKEILSSATVLPVEESWRKCGIVNREDRESVTSDYPNGVIIQPKQ